MRSIDHSARANQTLSRAFTLIETVFAVLVSVTIFGSVICGYVMLVDRAEWSSRSLAAQSLAMQAVEQLRAAQWDTRVWPVQDETGLTNFIQINPLDIPVGSSQTNWATNYVSVIALATVPPLRQLRADCVWSLPSRRSGVRGPFTNTAITLRAPDQ